MGLLHMSGVKEIYISALNYLHDNYPGTYEEKESSAKGDFPYQVSTILLHTLRNTYEIRYVVCFDLSVIRGFCEKVEIYKDGKVYHVFADTHHLYDDEDIGRACIDIIVAINNLLYGKHLLNPSKPQQQKHSKDLQVKTLEEQVKKLSNRVARLEGLL
ncbi:unknown [Lactobacillus phage Lb338-1]|uniref:Uncharacterized protein n=1 Tax=Lactobacillus phage Lb338-1 TaxID=2892342 RepID=C1KFC9_9CAUD|nr:hypothetical protein lb338_phage_19 [Lactobacillus phage Lb338-1]ACO36940.1 unknown [Lactobacillus phage Lb338-1]